MSLRIRFRGGPLAGKVFEFGDDQPRIVIGRDPDRCDVVLPADLTTVGREHLALERRLARYRLVLNRDNPVLVDGEPAVDEMELPETAWIRLGRDGPELVAQTLGATTVPPTEMEIGDVVQDLPGLVAAAARRSRWNRAVGLGVVVGLLALAAVLWWAFDLTGKHVAEETARVRGVLDARVEELRRLNEEYRVATEDLRERLSGVNDELKRVTPDLSDLREAVAGLGPRMEGVEERVARATPRMTQALRGAAPSVYVVVVQDPRGIEHALATAWVVGEGTLATNAHVADYFARTQEGGDLAEATLFVRSPGAEPRDHLVTDAALHPGYRSFVSLWETYRPTGMSPEGRLQALRPAGAACDVALLEVARPEELDPPLEIAPQAALEALAAGDVVGLVGYPSEEMSLGGVNLRHPAPTTQVAHVTAVTNFFLAASAPHDALLVQHALPVTGGASGSPILNEQGQVVAVLSAGNIELSPLGRAPSAVLVNFAQRADLVRELIEGRADEAQQPRTAAWEQGIRTVMSLQVAAERGALGFLERYLRVVSEDVGAEAQSLGEWEGTVATGMPGQPWIAFEDRTVDLPDAGHYVFFAWGVLGQDVDLVVLHETDDATVYGQESGSDWYAAVRIDADATATVRARVVGPRDAAYRLRAYRFP